MTFTRAARPIWTGCAEPSPPARPARSPGGATNAGLEALCREREGEIAAALAADLHKPDVEAFTHETAYVALHARHARRRLRGWARPRRMPVDLYNLPGRAWLMPEPRGPVLILAPWNYPFHLALTPLIGALAAREPGGHQARGTRPRDLGATRAAAAGYLDPRPSWWWRAMRRWRKHC
ncbi:MAG: aldehyde dehydrogenase family protein [Paracoccaceae bacterium]